jgi:hypothetical protein
MSSPHATQKSSLAHCETDELGRRPHPLRYTARKGRTTVTVSTERIIPFSTAIQRVIGGNKQNRIIHIFSPGIFGDDGTWRNTDGASIETGPRIYIPVRTHPHLGRCFVASQLAPASNVKPASGTRFRVQRLTF